MAKALQEQVGGDHYCAGQYSLLNTYTPTNWISFKVA